MLPNEALIEDSWEVNNNNSRECKYSQRFNKRYREKFYVDQNVRIAKRENIQGPKEKIGRFDRIGVVINICGNDSYLVKTAEGKIVKKRHYDLKGIGECKSDIS